MTQNIYLTRRDAAGLSLVELLIAMTIGLILLLGLMQVFSASRAAYQLSEGIARTQENARFAMDFLQRDIRMAGHFGCVNDQAHLVKNEGDPVVHLGAALASTHPLNFNFSVQGFEANGTAPGGASVIGSPAASWTPGLPGSISALSPIPGSDIIVLRYLAGPGVPVTAIGGVPGGETLQVAASGWSVLASDGVSQPSLYAVADCSHADVFPAAGAVPGAGDAVTTVQVSSPVPATELQTRYTSQPAGQAMLYRAESVVYYVAEGASGIPALWRARADSTGVYALAEELVEGVEALQFLYGQDTVANITSTTPPVGNITSQHTASGVWAAAGGDSLTQANAWRRVGLVQAGVLMSSPQRASAPATAGADSNIRVLGVQYTPATINDGRYRSSYESTIALRNRLFGN